MKKQILVLSAAMLFLGGSLMVTSCGNSGNKEKTSKEDQTEMVKEGASESTSVDTDMVAEAKYQCPMKCEGDKTYDKPGKCPKCGMDLKKVDEDDNEGHDHDGGQE